MKNACFNGLVGHLRQVLAGLPDRRTGDNRSYGMVDFAMGAFSVFFMQSPSFIASPTKSPSPRAPMPSRSIGAS